MRLDDALDLADFVNYLVDDEQTKIIRLAFAIGYTTLSKATAKSMHDTLDTVVTIYKHTQVMEDGDELP